MHNERLSRRLRFIVEHYLDGKGAELKESVLAIEIFGRTDHDPKQNSIVRTEASRLRARLNEYYVTAGKEDAVVIELPKGGYAPVLHRRQATVTETAVPRGRIRVGIAVTAALVVAGTVAFMISPRSKPITIGVLPLANVSQESDSSYFADGLTDQIIHDLSIIQGLAVRSSTSSFAIRRKSLNVREAGRQLGVDYILEGSVFRAGSQARIDVRLVRARDDLLVWSGRYERGLSDVLAIQDEISRGVVNSLRLNLGHGRRRYEVATDIYDAYLRARAISVENGFPGINRSIGPLEEVVARDPDFAPAWADLAAAYGIRSGEFQFAISGEIAKMRFATAKALELDPLLSQAHDAQGMVYAREGRWAEAERSFRRALGIDPNRPDVHRDYAMSVLMPLGRFDEAITQARLAVTADPLSWFMRSTLVYLLIPAGRLDEAQAACDLLPRDTADTGELQGRILLARGRIDAAIGVLKTAYDRGLPPGNQVRGELGYAYARAGRREDAEKLLASTSSVNPFNHAFVCAGLGDRECTIDYLTRAATAGPFRIGRELRFAEFGLVGDDPRVKSLRVRMGLPF